MVKNLPANAGVIGLTPELTPDWEDPMKEEMATRSSVPAWEIPGTDAQRVGHC